MQRMTHLGWRIKEDFVTLAALGVGGFPGSAGAGEFSVFFRYLCKSNKVSVIVIQAGALSWEMARLYVNCGHFITFSIF